MKKVFKFAFLTVLLLLLVVLVGGFIFIKTFDLNTYKSYVENVVYQQTGRKLALNGDAGLKISLIPTIVLNDVSLSNASWADKPEMVKAESVEVTFSVLPLLKKEIVVDTVDLIKPEVYLSVNKDGKANWEFDKPVQELQQSKKTASFSLISNAYAQTPAITTDEGFAYKVVAKNIKIENGTVVFTDLKNKSTINLLINSLALTSDDMDSDVDVNFDLVYNGEKISGTATVGSVNAILNKATEYPVKADIQAYGAKVQADVILKNMMTDLGFSGKAQVDNPAGNFGAPAISLDTEFSGNLDVINATLKTLKVAGNIINGKVTAYLKTPKPLIDAVLQSNLIDVRTFNGVPNKTALNLTLISSANAAEFVPATPLDLSALNIANVYTKLDVKKLIIDNDLSIDDIKLTAKLNNGLLNINPLHMQLGGGSVNGFVTVNANGNEVSINLTGKDIILQNLLKNLSVHDNGSFGIASGGNTDIKAILNGNGQTIRQIVENLNGQLIVVVGNSSVRTGSLKYLKGNLVSQLLTTLNLEKYSKNLDLKCGVIRADVSGGKAVFPKGIAFNSEQMTVVGDGSLNLKNDKIEFTIRPFNGNLTDTNVAQAISSLIKITGTVQSPSIGLDNSAVIKNVVGIAAAGPAFLGSQLLLDVDESPCYTALKGTSYQNMFPAPSGAKAASQGIYQGTSDAISDGVDMITDTAKGVFNMLTGKK